MLPTTRDDRRRTPAPRRQFRDGVHRQHQSGRHQHGSRDVPSGSGRRARVCRQDPQREPDGDQSDRHIDQENPVPAEGLGQDTAGEQADRGTGRADEAVDPDRPGPVGAVRKQPDHHGEDDRRGDRTCCTLEEPSADEHGRRGREPAQARRDREGGNAEQEDPASSGEVADPARQQQHTTERHEIGTHHDAQLGRREPEILLDRRQRNGHHGAVEDDHQQARTQHQQGNPASSSGQRGRC